MAAELTPQEQEQEKHDQLIAAVEAAVARTNPRLVEPAMSQRAPVFTQARQAYTQYGQVPLENQVVNPKLLEPLRLGTSVPTATMPQQNASMANPAGGYVIPKATYVVPGGVEARVGNTYGPEDPGFFESTDPVATFPEVKPKLSYIPADTPPGMAGEPIAPLPEVTIKEDEPLKVEKISAPQIGMNPRYAQGITERQNTLRDLRALLTKGEDPINKQEDAYTKRMGDYAADLGKLQDARGKLDTARGVERQIESADMARTAMRFDANRVFSDVASSPLGTAGLAIASGIVQGLNGYAGQDKPDAILSAIKDAATRDVGNQVKMSEAGEKSRLGSKNAYDEAIKSGADKQEAVRLAAMASLDQIGKGLDFMKARQVRAKDRADLEIASGALKSEAGKEFTNLAIKGGEMRLSAAIANMTNSTHLQVAQAQALKDFQRMSYEVQEKARSHVGTYMLDNDKGGAVLKNLTNAQEFYSEVKKGIDSGEKLEDLVARDWLATLSHKLTQAGSATDKSNGALMATFELQAGLAMKGDWSPAKKAVMSTVARMYSDRLREQLGKSQTTPELAAQSIVTDLKDPDSVMRFVRNSVNDANKTYQNQINVAPREYRPAWDAALGGDIRLALALEKEVFSGQKSAAVVQQ